MVPACRPIQPAFPVEALLDEGLLGALHPYSAGGAYVNMMMEEGQDRVKASYGANYERLAAIKAEYDPNNLFRMNQNIRPGA